MTMDDKDRQIVAALQDNGRLTNQELSERVNLSPSPCLRRVAVFGVSRIYFSETSGLTALSTDGDGP